MKKLTAVLGAVMVLFLGMATTADPAAAQAPTGVLEIEPASVDAPGEHEFEISLSEFSPGLALFVLPCEAPEGGDMANFDAASACDQAQLTPIAMDDAGTGSVTVTYEVGEDGLVIIAGDAARTELGLGVVTVGEAMAEEMADEEMADEEEEGGTGGGDAAAPLADTGVETALLAVVATTMVAGGAMVVRQTRRFS